MTIKEMRTLLGLTQQAFADKYGIPKRNIENWEGGKREPANWAKALLERAVLEDAERGMKIMEKYIVIHDINGDSFTTGFDKVEDAIADAQTQWRYLTRNEKKKSHIYVLESANPDVESDNHLDGNVVYEAEITDEAILALYKYLSMETSTENIQRDMQYGYLTENTGRDGDDYWWYFDEPKGENVAVNARTLDIVSDEDEIKDLFE